MPIFSWVTPIFLTAKILTHMAFGAPASSKKDPLAYFSYKAWKYASNGGQVEAASATLKKTSQIISCNKAQKMHL